MNLEFAKMHGLGNDFMVVDLVSQDFCVTSEHITAWADRRTGIGFDQLLIIEPPTEPDADFRYRIYNANGEEVEQCGNGARCVAKFIWLRMLSPKQSLQLETLGGPIQTCRLDEHTVEIDLGVPRNTATDVPYSVAAACPPQVENALTYQLQCEATQYELTPVSIGNPHGVMFVADIAEAPVEKLGAQLVKHPFFPQGANIGFCQIVDPGFARLRVFERGVGETRACGTGACAAVAVGRRHGKLEESVQVALPGGNLQVDWAGPGEPIWLTGPTEKVYEGTFEL
ncbi:MAG: diaminopimelate epimerase [Gammaproteobacteria bacterium]|nr:diaminopimelate epimerase [Gammaproteobacteria bacterium]